MHIIRFLIPLSLSLPVLLGCSVIPSSEHKPERVVEPWTDTAPAKRSETSLAGANLNLQNAARADIGVSLLAWDNALEKSAQAYANRLAQSERFEHDPDNKGPGQQGENLWTGTRGAYSYREMVQAWIDERQYFRRGVFPNNSSTGKWNDVAHYTQIIWPASTRMGCALASNARSDYLVCRYSPPGNVVGNAL